MDHRFQINLRGVIDLLSHHLYSSPGVYVRELLQNATDAIRARQLLEPRHEGTIRVELIEKQETLAAVARHTARQGSPDDGWLLGQFVTQLLIGVGRYARGERLSGYSRVKEEEALRHLVRLLARHVRSEHAALLDDLDVVRRFERVFPELGHELNAALTQETPQAALRMLDMAERELKERLGASFPTGAFTAARARIRNLWSIPRAPTNSRP